MHGWMGIGNCISHDECPDIYRRKWEMPGQIWTAGFLEILTTTCASFVCAHIEMIIYLQISQPLLCVFINTSQVRDMNK